MELAVAPQLEARLELLAEAAAATFGEKGVLGPELHALLIAVFVVAVLGDAHVAGGHAHNGAGVVVEDLGSGEAGIDFDAHGLGLLRHPAADVAERDDVVTLIVGLRRQHPKWHRQAALLGQQQELLILDRRVERRALVLPVRNQLVEGPRL